jgi:hypothetical protein
MELTIERLRLGASAANRTQSLNREARTFKAVALSGRPIQRIDPLTGAEFALRFDPAGADFSRISAGTCPLLNSHRDDALDDKIGYVKSASWENGALIVECQLGTSDAAEQLLRDLGAGIPAAVSLGVLLREWRDERDKSGRLTARTVTQWEIFEVSIVPVPADGAAVTLSLEDRRMHSQEQNREETFDAPAPAAAERERVVELNKIGKGLGVGAEFTLKHVEAGTSIEEFRKAALEELARRYEATPTRSHVAFVRDEGDTKREGLTLALTHRLRGGEPDPRAVPYLHLRLPDVARECLRWRGAHLAGMSDSRVVTLAMTTSDFPNILGNVVNRTLLDAYRVAEPALKRLARIVTIPDFRERRVLKMGEGVGLVEKPEAASYQYGAITEESSRYKIATFGRVFQFSREAIQNDDLGAIDAWARGIGRLAAEHEATLLASMIVANNGTGPLLEDGLPLFHSTRGNVASSGGVPSVSTLDAGRKAMRTRRTLDGHTLDANPDFLLVPAALQTSAEQLVTQITPNQASQVNPFAGKLQAISEPRLDAASPTAWYLACAPDRIPTFEFAYLEGAQGPQSEQEWDFDTDTWKLKVRLDCGCGIVDWRGIYKNPGA